MAVDASNPELYYGIGIAVLASTASNLGVNFQKYAFMKQALLPLEQQLDYTKLRLWWFGMALVSLGAIGTPCFLAHVALLQIRYFLL